MFSFLATASLLRYGVACVIVISVGYFCLHLRPAVYHQLDLLRNVYGVDSEGIRLEGDLQFQVQESRRRFLRILLGGGNPAERDLEVLSMRSYDATIAATETRLASLGEFAQSRQKQFHERWLGYVAIRDRMLAALPQGGQPAARRIDNDLGRAEFDSAAQSVRQTQEMFSQSSSRDLTEVSITFSGLLRELFLLIWLKLFVLALLVWIDWKRINAEKQLKKANSDLRASEDRFRQAYETAIVGMGIFKLDDTVISVNAKAAQMLGYERHELIGMKVSQLMAPEYVEDHLQRLVTMPHTQEGGYRAERRVIRKDGTEAWVRNSVTLLRPEGQEPYYFAMCEEITQQRKATERLAFLANYDPVTNLPNRRHFEEQLATALRGSGAGCIALLYLEIDSFDFLKGTFGRNVADDVLSELGTSFARFRREQEVIGRLDDHVFAMLMTAAAYDEATMQRAGELQEILRRSSVSGKHRIPLSASIGIAYSGGVRMPRTSRSSGPESEAETLLKFARAAMLEARSRGGDSICVADPSLQERAAQRHQIESALLRGLRENEFRVVFQPQFEISTGKLVRFEALCRWNSGELGPIPPDRFIPIAEQTGLISEIGRRILHEALREAKSWAISGRRIGLAVNISPMQFMRPDFTQAIAEAVALAQFAPGLLELEITEGIFIRDLNLAVARIRELQRLGLSVALDDFGTGYSSLSYLQRMPIDAVKLDRSFVSDLTTEPATVSMVQSVLAMASALHLRVVTEGVETQEQLEILRSLGCDEAQGYLLGRPESAEMALKRVMESPVQSIGTLA